MLKTLMQWLQAPKFPEDEDKTRSALLLNVILNTFLVALPVIIFGAILSRNIPRAEGNIIIVALAWLTIFGTKLVMHSGRVTLAGMLTVVIIFIATTLAIYNIGTIRAPATSFYPLTIVLSGLVISRRAVIWTACISSITIITFLLAERNGFLPPPTLTVTGTQGITFTVAFVITSILLYLAVQSIDEALARARLELDERQRTEDKLRASEERFRAMIENISDAIALVDANAIVHYMSPAAERILGYSNSERIGFSSFANLAQAEDGNTLRRTFEK